MTVLSAMEGWKRNIRPLWKTLGFITKRLICQKQSGGPGKFNKKITTNYFYEAFKYLQKYYIYKKVKKN